MVDSVQQKRCQATVDGGYLISYYRNILQLSNDFHMLRCQPIHLNRDELVRNDWKPLWIHGSITWGDDCFTGVSAFIGA